MDVDFPSGGFFDAVARSVWAPLDAVDVRACVREDYAQDLAEHALRASATAQEARALYTFAWRKARDLRRDSRRREQLSAHIDVVTDVVDPRDYLESRSCVRLLEKRLSPYELRTLRVLSLTGPASLQRRARLPSSSFYGLINRVRSRARAILEDSEMPEVDEYAHKTDADLRVMVPCYALCFAKSDDQCVTCAVRERCVGAMVASIPGELEKAGLDLTPANVRDVFEHEDDDTVQHLVQIVQKKKTLASILTKVSEPEVVAPVVEAPPAAAPAVVEAKSAKKPPKPPKSKKQPDVVADVVVAGVSKEKALEVVSTTFIKPKKKPAPTPDLFESQTPPPAPTVDVPVAVAKGKADRAKAAKKPAAEPVKVKAPKAPKLKAGSSMQDMWLKERERSPLVAALKPGTTLTKEYRGKTVEVVYGDGFVEWDGQKWPTLSAVKTSIVGKLEYPSSSPGKTRLMTNWSTPRFFLLGVTKKDAPVKAKKKAPTTKAPKPVKVPAKKKAAPAVKKAPKKAKKKKAPAKKKKG